MCSQLKLLLFQGALLGVVLLFGAGAVAAPPTVPEPRIPPGYTPVVKRDERGLWMEMEEYERTLQRSPLLMRDRELNDYLQQTMCRVAGPYCADARLYLIRNPGFNASMAPNGMMQVWTGILLRAASEDELASVLGHELAHYMRTDSIERFRKIRDRMSGGSILSFGLSIATGVYVPVGEAGALLSVLAFSREQEEIADLLGARLIADAGFDPHASYRIWETLMEEERRAESKANEPAVFMSTHPASTARSQTLRDWVVASYGPEPAQPAGRDTHRRLLEAHYITLMSDQLKTNRYGRTMFILERHEAMGIDPALVEYFRGRTYLQRGDEGDAALAREALEKCIGTARAPAEAHRELGYLMLKAGDRAAARELFARYLDVAPDATDRSMIEFYLKQESP
jgi:beta-barrel assembly-enhancing protease